MKTRNVFFIGKQAIIRNTGIRIIMFYIRIGGKHPPMQTEIVLPLHLLHCQHIIQPSMPSWITWKTDLEKNGKLIMSLNGAQEWEAVFGKKPIYRLPLESRHFYTRASMHAFQHPMHHGEADADFEPSLSQSSVSSYFGFDKRSGLSSMAKKMLKGWWYYACRMSS